jgi:hypothetical protein
MSDSRKDVTRNRRRRDVSRVDPDLSNAVADTMALWLTQHAERRDGRPIKNCPLIADVLLDVIEDGQPGNLQQVIMGADSWRQAEKAGYVPAKHRGTPAADDLRCVVFEPVGEGCSGRAASLHAA